jgi:dephospho-CoA kinase
MVPGMLRVALTGNIASGKSTVAKHWRRLGASLIDSDELARRAVAPGASALDRIAQKFGAEVLQHDGKLDRAALRRIVFSDEAARHELEAILHPEIHRLGVEQEAALSSQGELLVVHDIPLLFELGMEGDFDVVVLVDAPEDVRLERLMRDRGLAEDAARAMMDAQEWSASKRQRADFVIDNDSTPEQLALRAEETWRQIRQRASE